VSEPTQEHSTFANYFRIRGYHALWPVFPDCSSDNLKKMLKSYNPGLDTGNWELKVKFPLSKIQPGLGFSRFARHYSGNLF